MDSESIQISMSEEQLKQFAQLIQIIQSALSGGQAGCQPLSRFVTVDERCQYRWPLATPKHRQRIRDVCLARYRERLGRNPYKLTGCANAAFMIEEEYISILDRSIDIVRNKADEEAQMPLFARQRV